MKNSWEEIESMPTFENIEEEIAKAESDLQKAVCQICKIYLMDGYLKGVNDGIRISNAANKKQVFVVDVASNKTLV